MAAGPLAEEVAAEVAETVEEAAAGRRLAQAGRFAAAAAPAVETIIVAAPVPRGVAAAPLAEEVAAEVAETVEEAAAGRRLAQAGRFVAAAPTAETIVVAARVRTAITWGWLAGRACGAGARGKRFACRRHPRR